MILEQFYLQCLAQASYLIVDEKSGQAVVVDPRRDIDIYLEAAAKRNAEINHVVLTHFHADFVSGHIELASQTGAAIHLGQKAQAEYKFVPAKDGAELDLGSVKLGFLETPGHTPESICLLAYDKESDSPAPKWVFTGDTLFMGDVGRPDLMASFGSSAEELASLLYDSLYEKIMRLPDHIIVYPGHGAGSMCGKNLGDERFSTLGEQKKFNRALQFSSREEFIENITCDQAEAPAYFSFDAMLNRSKRETLSQVLERAVQPLPLDKVLQLQNSGAQILDTRQASEYGAVHLLGSVNIGLNGQFASWAGTLLDRDHPIVLLTEAGKEKESAIRLGRIGFDHVRGFLAAGIDALESRPDLMRHTAMITAQVLGDRLSSAEPPHMLDVRTNSEWDDKHIVGSVHIPLNQLRRRIDEVPRNSNFVVYCAGGYRSSIAASLLEQTGFSNFSELTGGYLAWELTEA